MSKSMLKIYVRVFERRLKAGESFEEIVMDYPRLTQDEITEIKKTLTIS